LWAIKQISAGNFLKMLDKLKMACYSGFKVIYCLPHFLGV